MKCLRVAANAGIWREIYDGGKHKEKAGKRVKRREKALRNSKGPLRGERAARRIKKALKEA